MTSMTSTQRIDLQHLLLLRHHVTPYYYGSASTVFTVDPSFMSMVWIQINVIIVLPYASSNNPVLEGQLALGTFFFHKLFRIS